MREIQIDSYIVRCMKSHKMLNVNELQNNVKKLSQNFLPDPKMVKSRIDSLIERDYLERDAKDMNLLIYKP